MTDQLHGLCSMATKELLDDLSELLLSRRGVSVRFEAAGGVDVARGLRAGVEGDLVVLAREQMEELDDEGMFAVGSLRALFVSDVVAAVPDAVAPVSLSTEEELRAALGSAERIAYSTGPSGTAFLDLLERWGQAESVGPKLLRAEPGTPVGSLLASGEANLGFQQRSELAGFAGVRVLGSLPGSAAIRSTFSGAVVARSAHPGSAAEVLDLVGSPEVEGIVVAGGMSLV